MISLFKKKYPATPDFSVLKTDMHSHLLPGIDDGSPNPEQSKVLIEGLLDLGYSQLITTPHILSDMFPNTPETILQAHQLLRPHLSPAQQAALLKPAAEYYLDDQFSSWLENSGPLLVLKHPYVLVEFPFVAPPFQHKEQLFQLQLQGFQPVLAHPERYSYYFYQKEVFDELKAIGCLFQLNLLSLAGYYGKQTQQMAEYLVKKKYINLLGTDMHHIRHLEALRTAGQLQPILLSLLDTGEILNPEW